MSAEGTGTSHAVALRSLWDGAQPAFGVWATIGSPLTAELAAATGSDYVCVDLQHGLADESAALFAFHAVAAAGATPLARVGWNEPSLIMRALDLGALGVIVPLVNGPGEAARAAAACRYPPHGCRSYGPLRASQIVDPAAADALAAQVLCFVMIETLAGLEHVEEIAATPGLDGIYIGPSDLSLALGLSPRGDAQQPLEDALVRIRSACDAHGLIAGMHCSTGADARERAAAGFRLVTVGVDSRLYRSAIARELADARAR